MAKNFKKAEIALPAKNISDDLKSVIASRNNQNHLTMKATKLFKSKSETKAKCSSKGQSRVLAKTKMQFYQSFPNDAECPSTSRQSHTKAAAIDSHLRLKSPIMNPWIRVCRRKQKREALPMTMRQQTIFQRKPTHKMKSSRIESENSENQTLCARSTIIESVSAPGLEIKTSSLIRFGITYSDVVRSKNINREANMQSNESNQNGNTAPIQLLSQLPAENATISVEETIEEKPANVPLNGNPSTSSGSSGSLSNNAITTAATATALPIASTPPLATTELLALHAIREGGRDISMAGSSLGLVHNRRLNSQIPAIYPKYNNLNMDWVNGNMMQHQRLNLPSFNYLQPNQEYPNFLGQFNDENYLKTDNLALLGLKLAMNNNGLSHFPNGGGGQ